MRWLLVMGLLTLLAVAGLQHRDELSAALKPALQAAAAPSAAAPPGAAPALKCVDAGGRVLYTTEPRCPAGQRAQALQPGAVNVIEMAKPAAAPASVAMPLDRIDAATR